MRRHGVGDELLAHRVQGYRFRDVCYAIEDALELVVQFRECADSSASFSSPFI